MLMASHDMKVSKHLIKKKIVAEAMMRSVNSLDY